VASGTHHAVRSRADHVAKGGKKLEEDGGWVGLCVWSDSADSESGEGVECGHWQLGATERGWSGEDWTGLLLHWIV
jgi:hypothetical protein